MTTWRLESMWTRTLSTTISMSPSAMPGLSHAGRAERPGSPGPEGDGDERAGDEAADVGEERDAALGIRPAERGDPVDELEDEPETQDEDRRDLDELVEEAQEHERQDPGARVQDEVRAERRGDRPRSADQRVRRVARDRHLGEAGDDAAQQVEAQEDDPAQAVLDVVAEDPQDEHVAQEMQPAAVEELVRQEGQDRPGQPLTRRDAAGQVGRHEAVLGEAAVEAGLAAARE